MRGLENRRAADLHAGRIEGLIDSLPRRIFEAESGLHVQLEAQDFAGLPRTDAGLRQAVTRATQRAYTGGVPGAISIVGERPVERVYQHLLGQLAGPTARASMTPMGAPSSPTPITRVALHRAAMPAPTARPREAPRAPTTPAPTAPPSSAATTSTRAALPPVGPDARLSASDRDIANRMALFAQVPDHDPGAYNISLPEGRSVHIAPSREQLASFAGPNGVANLVEFMNTYMPEHPLPSPPTPASERLARNCLHQLLVQFDARHHHVD